MPNKPIKYQVLLGGGLGNQLFQYAYGRAVSQRSGAELELDAVTLFANDLRYRRSYELDAFNLPSEIQVIRQPHSRLWRLQYWLNKKLSHQKALDQRRHLAERKPGYFDPDFAAVRPQRSCIIQGYWQCPKYFTEIESTLRCDLAFNRPIHPEYRHLADEMESYSSVAVHVRRKDFWSKLSILYYREAIGRLQERFSGLQFFVFTDDPDWWSREAGDFPSARLVHHPEASGIDDFQLMSRCRHFIIANSSFSWWASWLGNHPDKYVLAPSRDIWFSSWDVLPEDWEIVPVEKDAASRQPGVSSFTFIPKSK